MKSTYQGVLYALVGSILFSIKPVIIKLIYAVEDIDIIHLLLLRMLMSLPFYLIILLVLHKKKGLSKLSPKGKWHLVLLGFIGFYVASFLDFSGLQYIPASLERAIIFLNPTIVLLLSAVFLKRKIKPFQWLAIALTYWMSRCIMYSNTDKSHNHCIASKFKCTNLSEIEFASNEIDGIKECRKKNKRTTYEQMIGLL